MFKHLSIFCASARCLMRQAHDMRGYHVGQSLAHAGYFALAFLGWHEAYAYVSGVLCLATLAGLAAIK